MSYVWNSFRADRCLFLLSTHKAGVRLLNDEMDLLEKVKNTSMEYGSVKCHTVKDLWNCSQSMSLTYVTFDGLLLHINVDNHLGVYFGEIFEIHIYAAINIKMSSYQYRKSHCGDKTIWRPSYLRSGISYTRKTTSLYWIRALIFDLDLDLCVFLQVISELEQSPSHNKAITWRPSSAKRPVSASSNGSTGKDEI